MLILARPPTPARVRIACRILLASIHVRSWKRAPESGATTPSESIKNSLRPGASRRDCATAKALRSIPRAACWQRSTVAISCRRTFRNSTRRTKARTSLPRSWCSSSVAPTTVGRIATSTSRSRSCCSARVRRRRENRGLMRAEAPADRELSGALGAQRSGALHGSAVSNRLPRRGVHRAAWVVESQAAQRLQGDLRAARRGTSVRNADRCAQ